MTEEKHGDGPRVYLNARLGEAALSLLQQEAGADVQWVQSGALVSGLGASRDSLEAVDIAFGQPDPVQMLESKRLRWVHVSSAGITRYDTSEFRAALETRGIVLTNSSSVYDEPCAEQLLAFMLAGARSLPEALETRCDHQVPEWQALRERCPLLLGQRVVIFGYGAIARRLVELLAPFRMQIEGYRRTPQGDEVIPMVRDIPGALATADHVVNILPENADSRHFFDRARFEQMKPGALFYNMGRGATVEQTALLEALRSKHLGGAWLDVTEPEPLPEGHPLWAEPRCFITPHIGGGHRGEHLHLVRHFLENLRRFRSGEPLLDRVV